MSKKMNNTRLFIILGVLAVILVLTKLIKEPRQKSTLKQELMKVDTSRVDKILITRGTNDDKTITFQRKGDSWTVSQGSITDMQRKNAAVAILQNFQVVKPQRLAATSKSGWKAYELTDSTATKVTLKDADGKDLGSILIGKFAANEPSGGQNPYGRRNFSGSSYVRLPGDKDVYAIDGFLSMMFRMGFDDWRDKTLISIDRNKIATVRFNYPADSSFALTYKDSTWYAGNIRADSLKTSAYINRLSSSQGTSFKDGYTPGGSPAFSLSIEGPDLQPVKIECYQGEVPGEFILHSDQHPAVYFKSGKTGLFDRLFKPKEYFTKDMKK